MGLNGNPTSTGPACICAFTLQRDWLGAYTSQLYLTSKNSKCLVKNCFKYKIKRRKREMIFCMTLARFREENVSLY